MAKRRAKKRPTRKPVRRKMGKPAKKKSKTSAKSLMANKKAQWSAYKEMQKQVDRAWAKLRANVKRKASPQTLIRDKNNLLLLLGECNYMARECMRVSRRR